MSFKKQIYDYIKDTRYQIIFKIKELIDNHYKFAKALNMRDYVVNLLHEDNFIALNITRVNNIYYTRHS